MRRQRDAAFTDEIITNIKQFQPDTDCEKPDEMTDSHAKRKTCNSLVTGQKNVGYLGDSGACGVRGIDVKERHIRGAERLENKPFVDLVLIGTTTRAARKTLAGNLSTGHFDRGLSRPFRCRGSSAPFRCQKPEG